ncbi:helix-turn-helix transcriptional regulator [Micromonospora sp. FIMYZ51]|uniref:helix-turn-helix domain-containing protein n=1 Tax=Micromonospora sp. FIMYZ51 TaxID=3051832 RepID=UPI00311D76F4
MTSTPYARELADFLRNRRSRLRPEEIGLAPGPRRRVAGLRREELALLAGVSTDYYQRLEQGRDVRPSEDVLTGIARALALNAEETRHLHALARRAQRPPKPRRRTRETVPESIRRLLHSLHTPAVVVSRHLDLLAWNSMAAALYPGIGPSNVLIDMFSHPEAQGRCPGWRETVLDYLGFLRAAVAADPEHPRAQEIVGTLSIRSEEFRQLWARHDVREAVHGSKAFTHPQVGELRLDWDAYTPPGRTGPILIAYTAAPGSADAERMALLALARGAR